MHPLGFVFLLVAGGLGEHEFKHGFGSASARLPAQVRGRVGIN